MITRQQQHIFKILIVAGISFRALGVISKLTRSLNSGLQPPLFLESEMSSSALTDEEYRQSLGSGYIFFEITQPEQLSFTYKVRTKNVSDQERSLKADCSHRPTPQYSPPAGT